MLIDSIQNGIVIDHITAGKAMELYQILGLDKLACTVAILKNVTSGKLGRKDIIKIDGEMELDWDLIGYVDPSITVNIIRGGELQEKRTLKLPERIRGVLRCKNPRCITSTERELPQEFVLTDRERRVYRCLYCETEAGKLSPANKNYQAARPILDAPLVLFVLCLPSGEQPDALGHQAQPEGDDEDRAGLEQIFVVPLRDECAQ